MKNRACERFGNSTESAHTISVGSAELDAVLAKLPADDARLLAERLEPAWRVRQRRVELARAKLLGLAAEFYSDLAASNRAMANAIAADLRRATAWRWRGARSNRHHATLLEIVEIYDGDPPSAETIRKCFNGLSG